MSQPQFDEGPPVPLLVEGVIDAATLQRLFADLSAASTILGVRDKSGATDYASADESSLEFARERLLSGRTRAVQVRYRFADVEWSDTILALADGFRVVRCRHDSMS
jgi:hypothetical protein